MTTIKSVCFGSAAICLSIDWVQSAQANDLTFNIECVSVKN